MPLPLIGLGAAAVGGALGFLGGERANAANARQAAMQRDFQANQSATSYQRAVDDMKKAGLNPALAYQQGGASTPTGASAQITDSIAGGRNGAAGAAASYQAIQQTEAQTQQTRAQTDLTQAEATQLRIESADRLRELQARSGQQETNASVARNMFPFDVALKASQEKESNTRSELNMQNWKFQDQTFAQRMELLEREIDSQIANARESGSRTIMNQYQTPEMRNRAATQNGWWKKKVAPYLNDAKAVTRIVPVPGTN